MQRKQPNSARHWPFDENLVAVFKPQLADLDVEILKGGITTRKFNKFFFWGNKFYDFDSNVLDRVPRIGENYDFEEIASMHIAFLFCLGGGEVRLFKH